MMLYLFFFYCYGDHRDLHSFPTRRSSDLNCDALNPSCATSCHLCGTSFGTNFSLTLDEAIRTGAIVRGMEINEIDVIEGERIAQPVRDKVLRSGDHTLVKIIRALPDESFGRLKDILSSSDPKA